MPNLVYTDYPPIPCDENGWPDFELEDSETKALRHSIDNQVADGIERFLQRIENKAALTLFIDHINRRIESRDNLDVLVKVCEESTDLYTKIYDAMGVDQWIVDAQYRKLMFHRAIGYVTMRLVPRAGYKVW